MKNEKLKENELAYTKPIDWIMNIFESHLVAGVTKRGEGYVPDTFEGQLNLSMLSSHLEDYLSAKIKESLKIYKKNNIPSEHQINDIVTLEFFESGKIENCKIEAVRFTKGKTKYDVSIPVIKSKIEERKDLCQSTVVKNVDSICIKK